jgi:ABC-type dipeptide/oligopeptide/nickel transport system permease subunit
VRSQALSLKERAFVNVARLNGESEMEIVGREILPHALPWLGANFLNAFIAAILAESGLSILGLGPQRRVRQRSDALFQRIDTIHGLAHSAHEPLIATAEYLFGDGTQHKASPAFLLT